MVLVSLAGWLCVKFIFLTYYYYYYFGAVPLLLLLLHVVVVYPPYYVCMCVSVCELS